MSVRKRLTKHGDSRWLVDYRDGSGIRRNRQFATKAEATAFAAKARVELHSGVHTADSASITVAQAAELWLARAQREGLEPGTVLSYRQHAELHIMPFLGSTRLSRLTLPALAAFRDQLLDSGRSADMAHRVLVSLSGIMGHAQRRGLVAFNPVPQLERRRRNRHERRPLMPSREEMRALLAVAEDPRDRIVVLLGLLSGLRASELRGLTWSNVDLKAGVLQVTQRADRWGHQGPPKSQASRRHIPLGGVLLTALKAWRLRSPPGRLDLVLPAADGGVKPHGRLSHRLGRLQLKAGVTREQRGRTLAKYGLHALRHACAALWIDAGLGPKRIQALMGHASIALTFDTYGYLLTGDEERERAELDSLAARLLPAPKLDIR